MGRTTLDPVGGGELWQSQPRLGEERGTIGARSSLLWVWPFRVLSWSNNEWWFLSVVLACPDDYGGAYVSAPDFLTPPPAGAPYWRSQSPYRGERLQASLPEAVERSCLSPVPGPPGAFWLSGHEPPQDPAAEKDPVLAKLRAEWLATQPPRPPLADLYGQELAARPPPVPLRLVPPDVWEGAEPSPPPEALRRYLSRPDLGSCLQHGFQGDPDSGDATVGVYAYTERPVKPDVRSPAVDVVQWSLGPQSLAVTLFRRDVEFRYGPGSDRLSNRQALMTELEYQLPRLLGEYGRRLTLVPVDIEDLRDTNWWCVTPRPDTEVGLLERVKVGDTLWGKCRIYVDPAILHIVFDLPKEE